MHTSATQTDAQVCNALTVDVEDWPQSALDPRLPLTDRFLRNTHAVLEAFAARGVHGTFFVLGLAAEKAPEMVRAIQDGGHEVQSHGYRHRLVHQLTPDEFRADVERSKKLLEDITGQPVNAYRAPGFSITLENLWALDVLAETGYECDSSVFPLRTRRYGIAGAPRHPHRLRTPHGYELKEFPVASYQIGSRRLPIGGGGYVRLFPYFVIRRGLRQLNAAGQPATIYMHPYEYDPFEFDELEYAVPWRIRLRQGLGRRGFPHKIDRMLAEFRFGPLRSALASLGDLPVHEHRRSDCG